MKVKLLVSFLFLLFISIESLKVGDTACISAGLNLRDSPCGNVKKTSNGSEKGKVEAIKAQKCSFGSYTWAQVSVGGLGKVWAAIETGLIRACNPGKTKDHNVPQVHQMWDTHDSFYGSSACGPTSAVMAAAYYKKLKPHPMTISLPTKHTNDYGWYVSHQYTSPSGVVLSRGQKDPKGRMAYGAFGTCTEGGLAWAWRIQEFFKYHNLKSKFYSTATPQIVKSAIDQGHLVILSTQLTSSGHIILIRGYENDGAQFIANDPYGNANVAGYGKSMNGKAVRYTWAKMKTKWMVEVWN